MESSAAAILTDGPSTANLPLAKRFRAGVGWNTSSSVIGQAIGFVRSIVIARLLMPDDFGLFSMALTVVAGLSALTTTGLDRTIQVHAFESNKELTEYANTVWSTELLRSLFLAVLIIASAYPMAQFFGQPGLMSLVVVLSFAPLIEGCQNIGLAILRKQISFARIFWYELTVNVASVAFTVFLAVIMKSVWALVVGQLVAAGIGTILSYVFHHYRPRLAFEKAAFQSVLSFGKFALIIAIASYITTMADNVVVGRMLGASALGNYALAYSLASLPIAVVVNAINKVTLPALSELAAPVSARLSTSFTKVFTVATFILITITVPVCLLSGDIVQLLYGHKWAAAGPVLKTLSLMVPFRGLLLIVTTVFFALNKSRIVASGKALEAAVFLLSLYPLTKAFGLIGAAIAAVLSYGFALTNRLVILRRVVPGLSGKLVRILLSALAASLAGYVLARLILSFLDLMLLRILLGGFMAMFIPGLLLLWMRADLRKWIAEAAHLNKT